MAVGCARTKPTATLFLYRAKARSEMERSGIELTWLGRKPAKTSCWNFRYFLKKQNNFRTLFFLWILVDILCL